MAGNGPAPAAQRRRRNADVYADVQSYVDRDTTELRGPELRDVAGIVLDTFMFPEVVPLVEAWWDTWRRSPLAATFLGTDWQRLTMLVPLVLSYYAKPHYTKLAEIRQSESLLGATHVDRLKARIKVTEEPKTLPAGVPSIDDYRKSIAS